jgi:hypothetical protein
MKISFYQNGRTGNVLFQYIACKLFSLLFGHEYIPLGEFEDTIHENKKVIGEGEFENIFKEYVNFSSQDTEKATNNFSTLRFEKLIFDSGNASVKNVNTFGEGKF